MFANSDGDPQKIQKIIENNFLINENNLELREQFRQILETAVFCTNGESSSIMLKNPHNNSLYFEAAVGVDSVDLLDFTIGAKEGIAGWVLQNNRSLIVNDTNSDKRFFSKVSKLIGYPTQSILAVPLRVWNTCVGVIEIVNKNDVLPFTDDDRQWAEILANQAGLAIINSKTLGNGEQIFLKEQQRFLSGQQMIFESEIMKKLLDVIEKIAKSDASVFITGESGVGKELVAERIHALSYRAEGPLVKINCPSLPELLLESELFGHVKGAFTDAIKNRQGKLEIARGGTLFLDEITDITQSVQAKLLRVLESKKYEPLGSNQIKTADVRIVSATNKNLEQEVQDKRFREDLFYRLNIIPLTVPPLRRRPEDIPVLAEHFLQKIGSQLGKPLHEFSPEAFEQLMNYSWPGNIRELYNSIERAVILCTGSRILPEHLLLTNDSFNEKLYLGKSLKNSVNLFKKYLVRSTLLENNWNQTKTAEKLKIQRTYLSRLIKELGIERKANSDH